MIDGEEKSLDAILGESLGSAYDAAEAAPEPVDGDAGAAAITGVAPSDGRVRDEQGRFAPKTDSQAAPSAPAATTVAKPNTDQGSKPDDGAAPLAPSDVPASWPAALKNHWATLPPELKSHLQAREADFARGIEQKTRGFEALEQVIAPRRVGLAAEFGSVENAIGTLFKLSDFAAQDKPGFVKWFCQAHNLDPQTIFGGAQAPQPGQGGDPAAAFDPMAAVNAQIQGIKREVREMFEAPIKAKAQTELQKFEADPKNTHVHDQRVRARMKYLLEDSGARGEEMTYEQAYEDACASFSDIRKQMLEDRTQAAIEAKAKEAAEAARKARNTAGPQLRSVGTPNEVRSAPRGIDDTLSEVWDRNQGAA
jgi:hypothetical protein